MADKPFIPIILGTARVGRQSEGIARYIFENLKGRSDLKTTLVDVREFISGHTIPPWENNEITKPWRDIVKQARAFIVVTPEYNHGYPGELKMLLDQDGKEGYGGKPVFLCGVSGGPFGGARVVENLLPVMRELGLITLSSNLYFPNVVGLLKLSKEDLDKEYQERLEIMVKALLEHIT